MPQRFELLSLGVLLIISSMLLVAYAALIITRPDEVISLIIVFFGVWMMILAGLKINNPEKYGRRDPVLLGAGILVTTFGGAWLIYIEGTSIIISVALLLVVIGILAVATALPSIRKK